MTQSTSPLDYLSALDRYKFLTILSAGDTCEEHQFVKQACMLWLVNYPGDLYVQYLQALNYEKLGMVDQAKTILNTLIELDPQFIEAIQALAGLSTESAEKAKLADIVQYLTEEVPPADRPSNWLTPLWEARQAYKAGDIAKTTELVHQSMLAAPTSPLPAVLHLKAAYQMHNTELLNNLAEIYYQEWPQCLQINIIKALAELDKGKESTAVERLHWAAAHDSSGQVIQRLLGYKHRFQDLWPDTMEIYFDLAIPASVSTHLGWNQLDNGVQPEPELVLRDEASEEAEESKQVQPPITAPVQQPAPSPAPKTALPSLEDVKPKDKPEGWATDEDFKEIQQTFDRLAKKFKKSDLERADNRFPVYVILSSKTQLEAQYGPNTAGIIDELLQDLAGKVGSLPDWGAQVFYPDDANLLATFGLKPTMATDAWKVKLSLAELDEALGKQGEMIGALLIVGGPEIIPFHNLPNPTYDNDLDVASDNPYSTVDENYFIPQWPVGRLPGETGSDAGLLLFQIRNLIYKYEKRTKKGFNPGATLSAFFARVRQWLTNIGTTSSRKQSMGYSAEVWKEASAGVYSTIGKAKDLVLSPPTDAANIILSSSQSPTLGYFNLHGVQDGPDWYGQKDFSSESTGPDYPVALSPGLFSEKVPSPGLVYSEACYGANIIAKEHDGAMSLKFLDSGTDAFIGSTCIAYGAVTMPLVAADYLGELFWKQLLDGDTAGYALMRAKLTLAQEMTRLQGFLDGEDQKTLLSFVLYGDPLAIYDGLQATPKPLFRAKERPAVKTISDSELDASPNDTQMPKAVAKTVKQVVEKYLPGLHNAQMKVNTAGVKTFSDGSKSPENGRYYVTLEKSIDTQEQKTPSSFCPDDLRQERKTGQINHLTLIHLWPNLSVHLPSRSL